MSKSNERLVQNTLKTLGKDFIVVGKSRVRSWHAWLAIGVAVGVAAGVLFVANRSGEFDAGMAQVVAPTTGNIYYVGTNGNDANSGTQASPFLTIQKAAGIASPGDTVIVKPGTYTNAITTNRGGTAISRIRFISEQKWGAKIKTSGVPYAWINNVNYINIEGFDISGDAKIGILNYASHVKVIGNHVHHLGRADCGDYGPGDMGAGINNPYFSIA